MNSTHVMKLILRFASLLCGIFILSQSAYASCATPGYYYQQTQGSPQIQVTYLNPANPTWVYVYWVGGASTNTTPYDVHLPLTGADFSAHVIPNEAIRHMDQSALLRGAVQKFTNLIISRNYSAGKDPNFSSLVTLLPAPSSVSLMHILLERDPELGINLNQISLDQLPLDAEQLKQISRAIHLPETGANLGDFAQKVAAYQTSWREVGALGVEDALIVVMDALSRELQTSSERMGQTWLLQRTALIDALNATNRH